MRLLGRVLAATLVAGVVTGCSATDPVPREAVARDDAPPPWVTQRPSPSPSPSPSASPTPSATPSPPSVPDPRRALLSVPALGLVEMPVERYRGTPDDAPGTAIQDTGIMASPRGSGGLVGPGMPGNYLVTGHRTSHGAPLADLPALARGDRIVVRAGRVELVYRVTGTRITSFRSESSLREQSAAVPGRPRAAAGASYLTLSTCRTPEDHAEGNYWSDEHGNPEHRIDKIAVLVRTRPA